MTNRREINKAANKPGAYMLRLLEQYRAEGGTVKKVTSSTRQYGKKLSVAKKRLALELSVRRL